jgi:hypothetical protein
MRGAGLLVATVVVSMPAVAAASDPPTWVDPDAASPMYVRFEGDATALVGFVPTPLVGGQVALAAGRPWIHARVGVGAAAAPAFDFAGGSVGTVVETADVRACGAAHRTRHRFRLCAGGQAGVMHLRWMGYDVPGRRELPVLGAILGGDYGIALGRLVDLHAGIDMTVPIVGARLSVRHPDGVDRIRTASVATAFRLGLGFRFH